MRRSYLTITLGGVLLILSTQTTYSQETIDLIDRAEILSAVSLGAKARLALDPSAYAKQRKIAYAEAAQCAQYATIRRTKNTQEEKETESILNWVEVRKILPDAGRSGTLFGGAVATEDDVLAVGAVHAGERGTIYVFGETQAGWQLTATLTPPPGDDVNGFGTAVDIRSGSMVISAVNPDIATLRNEGAVYLFTKRDRTWSYVSRLVGPADSDEFGRNVAISGDTIFVAQPGNVPDRRAGVIHAYSKRGNDVVKSATLSAPDGPGPTASFGMAMAAGEGLLAVGAPYTGSGELYLYRRSGPGGMWRLDATLRDDSGYRLGSELAVSSELVLARSVGEDRYSDDSVYVFEKSRGEWCLSQIITSERGNEFGSSLAIAGRFLFVGANDDDWRGTSSGVVHVYSKNGQWRHLGRFAPSDVGEYDYFGGVIVASKRWVIVGASSQDDFGTNSGAAYAVRLDRFPD